MTPDQFQAASIALLRSAVGWQSKIAAKLSVDRRTVVRWLSEGRVPSWVDEKFAALTGLSASAPWPRDEWMIGDALGADGRRREYIAHLQPPRFVARVVAVDDEGEPLIEEEPADTISGVVYASDDAVLCEIEWIDRPSSGEITQLLEAAADALERDS